ncbi:hypothetical protein ABT063_07165 [Streptomyces sp. NPDC002838]|uniref:hypothetical protein n=1 Tax=Streptomyces sp. NPDC002838 TaxID=3154436 RepID=UPI003325DB92
MQLPSYWIPRPVFRPDRETTASFDRLLDHALDQGPEQPIDYRLDAPKWQFLSRAAERADVVLHGSGNPDIGQFEPRQPADTLEFSNRCAVFAATDGIWPMYYAILNRERHPTMMLCNACIRVISTTSGSRQLSDPYYFFSISRPALEQQPWCTGTVYFLPADSFEAQPPIESSYVSVQTAQVASRESVKPAARISVHASDFPFLRQIRGHDDELLHARIAADPDGFPWLAED